MKVYWLCADCMGGYQYFDSLIARDHAELVGEWRLVYAHARGRGEDEVDDDNLIEILNRSR